MTKLIKEAKRFQELAGIDEVKIQSQFSFKIEKTGVIIIMKDIIFNETGYSIEAGTLKHYALYNNNLAYIGNINYNVNAYFVPKKYFEVYEEQTFDDIDLKRAEDLEYKIKEGIYKPIIAKSI
jgi:hypothetical protein